MDAVVRSPGATVVGALALALVLQGCGSNEGSSLTSRLSRALGLSSAPERTILTMKDGTRYVDGELLVRFKQGASRGAMAALNDRVEAEVVHAYKFLPDLHVVRIPSGKSLDEALAAYQADPSVEYVERNVMFSISTVPNDPQFSQLWGMSQSSDADINAPEAWDLTTGSSNVVVFSTDTGVDYTHEDLAANVWTNPGEIPGNGVDDDGNGYVDDIHGVNVITGTGDPMDDNDHGTHTSGTMGASGNNGKGVAGVNWNVKIGGCKFLDSSGSGSLADAVKCFDYIYNLKTRATNPVNIIASNNSWGCGSPLCNTAAMRDGIAAHGNAGMLFMAAAGNANTNNDIADNWPSNYYLPNMIAVAASTETDAKASFSGYGLRSVHLAAPGNNTLSTTPGNTYQVFSGTSMATPHVTGAAALLKAQDPSRDWRAIKNLLISSGSPKAAFATNTISGRRLRLFDAAGGTGALTCNNQVVRTRLQPRSGTTFSTVTGSVLSLAALNINCGAPNGNVVVNVTGSSTGTVTLTDDGLGTDQVAGDGIYSGEFIASSAGSYTLDFGGGDTLTVLALDVYRAAQTPTPSYENMTAANVRVGGSDDQIYSITAPFPIKFANHPTGFTSISADTNGRMSFSTITSAYANTALPTASAQTVIAPFWDDLLQGASPAGIFTETIGTTPNRKFVIEYRNATLFSGTCSPALKFQVVFFENSSDVQYNYASVNGCSRGSGATVGLQVSPTVAQQFSFNTASLSDNFSLLFRTSSPPVVTAPSTTAATIVQGDSVTFNSSFTDADGAGDAPWTAQWAFNYDGITFPSPADLTQTYSAPGAISASYTYTTAGTLNVAVRMLDKDNSPSGIRTARITVANAPPTATIPSVSGGSPTEGSPVTMTATFTDPGIADNPWTAEWDFHYDGTTFRPEKSGSYTTAGTVSATFTYTDNGTYTVALRVKDKLGGYSTVKTATIDVADVNPLINTFTTRGPSTATEPATMQFDVSAVSGAADGTSDKVTYYLWDYDGDGAFDQVTNYPRGLYRYLDNAPSGTYNVTVRVEDEDSYSERTIPVTITNVPPTMVAVASGQTASEGAAYSLQIAAADQGPLDTLTFSLPSAPAGMWIDSNGMIRWVPSATQVGVPSASNDVTVRVTDKDGAMVEQTFTIDAANVAPTIAGASTTLGAIEGNLFTYQVQASDPGGPSALRYSVSAASGSLPGGLSISSSGLITWVPSYLQTSGAGTAYQVLVTVTDNNGASASTTLNLSATWRDADNDGMADTWELTHGLNPTVNDAAEDMDGDGISNIDAFYASMGQTLTPGPGVLHDPAAEINVNDPMLSADQVAPAPGSSAPLSYVFEVYSAANMAPGTRLGSFTVPAPAAGSTVDLQLDNITNKAGTDDNDASNPNDVTLVDNTYYWYRVQATDGTHTGAWSALQKAFFNPVNDAPSAPRINSPANGSAVSATKPRLVVDNATDPDSATLNYKFEVFSNSAMTSAVATSTAVPASTTGATSWDVNVALNNHTTYYWRATVTDNKDASTTSASGSFNVNLGNKEPSIPALDSPAAGATVTTATATLTVKNATDADGDALTYWFEVDSTATFSSTDRQDSGSSGVAAGSGGTTSWTTGSLKENTRYYWRARASDGQSAGDWVTGSFFVDTKNDAPGKPIGISPADGSVILSTQPTLTVLNATDPEGDNITGYNFQVHADKADGTVVAEGTGVASGADGKTSFAIPEGKLEKGKTYFWTSQATDARGGTSEWSTPAAFMVQGGGCGCGAVGGDAVIGGLLPMAIAALAMLRVRRRR